MSKEGEFLVAQEHIDRGWISNVSRRDLEDATDLNRTKAWLHKAAPKGWIIDRPAPTPARTVEELEAWGLVGTYHIGRKQPE